MRKRIQRWTFVLGETLKNLAMGSKAIRSLRGSRTRRADAEDAAQAAAGMRDFYLNQMGRRGLLPTFLRGKRALEVGPGSNLIVPLWFLAHGAQRAEGIDRFQDLLPPNELAKLHAQVAKAWPSDLRAQVAEELAWAPPGNEGDRLGYRTFPIESSPRSLDGSFDLIVSFNTLEHVKDVSAAMRSMFRLLARGGLMIHRVNCGTHGNAAAFGAGYLNQLTFGPRLWRLMYSNRGGTNQEPMGTFVSECERAGFKDIRLEVLEKQSEEEVQRLRPSLHSVFRERQTSDLQAIAFALTATKP